MILLWFQSVILGFNMDSEIFWEILTSLDVSSFKIKSEKDGFKIKFPDYPLLSDDVIYKIISLIKFPKLVSLKIHINNLLHFQELVETLSGNHSLKKLDLSSSKFLSFDSCCMNLDEQIKYHELSKLWNKFWNLDSSLELLFLNNCQISTDVFKIMAPNGKTKMKIKGLFLNNNPLGNDSMGYLSKWESLLELEVGGCGFNAIDDEANFDISFLEKLVKLKKIKFDSNPIGDLAFGLISYYFQNHPQLGNVSLRETGLNYEHTLRNCCNIIAGVGSNIINFDIRGNNFKEKLPVATLELALGNLSVALYNNRLSSILSLILAGRRLNLSQLPPELWEWLVLNFCLPWGEIDF